MRKMTEERDRVAILESANGSKMLRPPQIPRNSIETSISEDEKHRSFLLRNIDVVTAVLEALYGSPRHGNKLDPMDELVYIHLSKKTNEKGYTKAFEKLSTAFPRWTGLAEANTGYVKSLIASAGLGDQRTEELLFNVKKIKAMFGKETLDPLRSWSEKRLFEFLTGLRGVGPKSARCIMLFSLGKKVFPVDTHVHTICERMGYVEKGLSHKVAQEKLAELFPKKYRYSLHVNMVAHGRRLCKKRGQPACNACHLRKFCRFYRNGVRKSAKGIPMIDLFCGAGGASLGLRKVGFSVKLAVDNDIHATDTYYLNQEQVSPTEVLTEDIRLLDDECLRSHVRGKIDLLFGGPPCQGWSNIGKNRKNGKNGTDFLVDEKNTLYREFLRQLDNFRPRYFVMENVPGLLTAHGGKYVEIIRQDFLVHKYESVMVLLNASDFGIAQNRNRIFFIGRRIPKSGNPASAQKELSLVVKLIREGSGKEVMCFREAVEGVPHLKPGEGTNVMRDEEFEIGESCTGSATDVRLIFNHFARKHNNRDLRIYTLLSEGEDYGDFSRNVRSKDLLPYSNESFKTKFRKIKGNDACYAIISHLSRDSNSYIHPDDNRGLTVREAARIQSFPDDFIFLSKGFRQFVLVGNAVPPKLAEFIGASIMHLMKR